MVPITLTGTRGARGVRIVSHHGMRDERAGVLPTRSKKYQRCSNRDASRDAKCGTVVPQQVDLFVRGEVWRHTEVSCTRNRNLGGSATRITPECPPGAKMALKDYSDNEAVRSRGQDLVST